MFFSAKMSSRGSFHAMKSFIQRKMTSIQASAPTPPPPPTPSYVTNEKFYSERRWLLSSIVFVTGFVIAIEHFAVHSRFESLEEIMEVQHKKIEAQQRKTHTMAAKLQYSIEKLTSVVIEIDDEEKKTTKLLSGHSTTTL